MISVMMLMAVFCFPFTKADDDHNWKIAHVTLNAQKKFRYLFQGLKGNPSSSSGGIIIDDITLTETPCPTAVWVVRNFSQILENGSTAVIQSPRFYSPEGYAYGISLYPQSNSNGYTRVAFHLCSVENDAVLEWPALNRQAMLTVLDQDPDVLKRMSASRSFTTNRDQTSSECCLPAEMVKMKAKENRGQHRAHSWTALAVFSCLWMRIPAFKSLSNVMHTSDEQSLGYLSK